MRYTFCPKCGSRLTIQMVDGREELVCTDCAFVFYQNSKPAVGALILDRGRLILVKRGLDPFKGYWDIPGGFLEAGEHPEAGVIREIEEETGLLTRVGEMLGIFMDIYGPSEDPTLNIFYLAAVTGGQARAGSDAIEIAWFDLKALPEQIAFKSAGEALAILRKRME